jgi:Flp pilus assembly protein TadG
MSPEKHPSKSERGSVFVEFALSSILLIAVFTGTFQFGYTFYVYNSLLTAVNVAARYASLHSLTNNGDATIPASFRTDVQNIAVYGTATPAGNAQPVAPGLTINNINVTVNFDQTNKPATVSVSLTGYEVDAIRTFTFTGKPLVQMDYFGSYCPEVATCL